MISHYLVWNSVLWMLEMARSLRAPSLLNMYFNDLLWYNYIIFPFFPPHLTYPSSCSPSNSWSHFFNCCSHTHAHTHTHTCTPLLSLYNATCMYVYVFPANYLCWIASWCTLFQGKLFLLLSAFLVVCGPSCRLEAMWSLSQHFGMSLGVSLAQLMCRQSYWRAPTFLAEDSVGNSSSWESMPSFDLCSHFTHVYISTHKITYIKRKMKYFKTTHIIT